MKPKPRDEGSKQLLDRAVRNGVDIWIRDNGIAFVDVGSTPTESYRGITYSNEEWLGNFLIALIVDGGGHWTLRRESNQ